MARHLRNAQEEMDQLEKEFHVLIKKSGVETPVIDEFRSREAASRAGQAGSKTAGRVQFTTSSRVQSWQDGARIRHWVDNNSVKLYNEQNIVRIEMTMNRPDRFKVFRFKQGQQQEGPKQRLPLRKGVVDLPLRAKVSADVNQRLEDQLATFTDTTPVAEAFSDIGPHTRDGRKVRALDPTGKDQLLLQAIADPALKVSGITNKALQSALAGAPWAKGKTGKALLSTHQP